MANIKLVPNQKAVKVNKEPCNKNNLYAAINLQAMEEAARNLDAAAFKLWVYFAKNQNGYEFALSSKDVLDTFGMKKDQYNRATEVLIKANYLVQTQGSYYTFNERALQEKTTTQLQENPTTVLQEITTTDLQDFPIRNITVNNTIDNTKDNIHNNYSPAREIELSIEDLQRAPSAPRKQEQRELWRF